MHRADVCCMTSCRADDGPMSRVRESGKFTGADVGTNPEHAYRQSRWWFTDKGPRLVLLLGDRAETLAVALAATELRIPVAHIHGGERTPFSVDDRYRWAISSIAVVHFVAHVHHGMALIRAGEPAERVFTVGAPGTSRVPKPRPQTERNKNRCVLLTWHPFLSDLPDYGAEAVAEAMVDLQKKGFKVVWTGCGPDPGAEKINKIFHSKLGASHVLTDGEYLLLMSEGALVVGNSSSGIFEAPAARTPTVNIGPRQSGRLVGPSIINVDIDRGEIFRAVLSASVYNGEFIPVYGDAESRVASKIADIVLSLPSKIDMMKKVRPSAGA